MFIPSCNIKECSILQNDMSILPDIGQKTTHSQDSKSLLMTKYPPNDDKALPEVKALQTRRYPDDNQSKAPIKFLAKLAPQSSSAIRHRQLVLNSVTPGILTFLQLLPHLLNVNLALRIISRLVEQIISKTAQVPTKALSEIDFRSIVYCTISQNSTSNPPPLCTYLPSASSPPQPTSSHPQLDKQPYHQKQDSPSDTSYKPHP